MGAGDEILRRMAALEAKLERVITLLECAPAAASGGGSLAVADDSDLDGQYGNPDVKFMPKKYSGAGDYKGTPMSHCPSDFLDVYAEALQWSSEHPRPGKEKFSSYDARDAARARGWARRLRNGFTAPQAIAPDSDDAFGGGPAAPFDPDALPF